jgi:hypothetical protein
MSTMSRLLFPICTLVLLTPPLCAQSEPKPSSTLITATEIEKAGPSVGNAFDAVETLRPRWLRAREVLMLPGENSEMRMSQIHVYMDDHDKGDLEFLKTIPAELIYTLRYMSTNEVGSQFGPATGPGIVVTLKH